MNGLKKSTGILTALLIAEPVYSDLKTLDDSSLGAITGQSGISIELSANVDIGEIAYQDEAFLIIENLSLGGIGNTALDNILMTIDVAGNNETLTRGFSTLAEYAKQGLIDSSNPDVAAALAAYDQGTSTGDNFNDGDLVIHLEGAANGVNSSNSSDQNIEAFTRAVDFGLTIDQIALTDSAYQIGSGPASGTSMFSDLAIEGYLGPTDLIIRNGGTGTSTIANGSMTVSDTRVELDSHFEITDLDVNWDVANVLLIFNFAALKLQDVKIHNRRGEDTTGHFGMASISAKVGEGSSTSNNVSGLALYDIDLRMDIDMPHVQFGSSPSIGEVYMTDFVVTADLVVYGH
ncbi:MAG: DUF6160 family protein [Pseudomonadales bacterium]|nr:DUF6160 family protein [Pseudomonadales bacterium]